MRVAIRKWGNSLALRIPKSVADDAVITLGSEVDLRVDDEHPERRAADHRPTSRRRCLMAGLPSGDAGELSPKLIEPGMHDRRGQVLFQGEHFTSAS